MALLEALRSTILVAGDLNEAKRSSKSLISYEERVGPIRLSLEDRFAI